MERMKSWMLAAILFCGVGCFVSCSGNADADKAAQDTVTVADSTTSVDVMMDAINQYLVDSIGSQYSAGDMCIPVVVMTCTEGVNADSVFKWVTIGCLTTRWWVIP